MTDPIIPQDVRDAAQQITTHAHQLKAIIAISAWVQGIDGVESRIANAKAAQEAAEALTRQATEKAQTAALDLASVRKQVDDANAERDAMRSIKDAEASKIISDANAQAKTIVETAQATAAEETAAARADIVAAQAELAGVNKQVDDAKVQIADRNAELADLNAKIADAKAWIANLGK